MARIIQEDPLVVIFGAYGMLGHALMLEAQKRNLRHHLHGRDADITDSEAVREALSTVGGPAVVINVAAMTHVDACEEDKEKAFAVNAWGPRVIARALTDRRPRVNFVHVSTGAVFDGLVFGTPQTMYSHPGYDEFEPVRPVSTYAKTKWAGEVLVRELYPRALIVRLGHLYGPGGKNGLSTAKARLLAGERFSINGHCRIGPTYVVDAARVILDAALAGVSGTTLHVSPEGSTTALGFVKRMGMRMETDSTLVVGDSLRYPLGQDALGEKIFGVSGHVLAKNVAWRPDFQLIRSSVLRHHSIAPIGTWEEGLDRYLAAEAP